MPEMFHGESEAERSVLRALRLAVELTAVILVLELVGAYLSRSLALTVDAVHDIPDLIAFAVSWSSLKVAETGASPDYSYGRHRFEVFASLLNAALVLGTGTVFGAEAALTLLHGGSFAGPVDAIWILLIALPTLALRAGNVLVLGRIPGRTRDLNLRSVLLHLGADLLIAGALLVTAVLLLLTPGLAWVDPAAALLIGGLLVYESLPLFRGGWEVLTEQTPRAISLDAVRTSALEVPQVLGIHDIHIWAVCPTLVCMTAHVDVQEMTVREGMQVAGALRDRMQADFGILHATFEVEAPSPERSVPVRGPVRGSSSPP